MGNHFSTSTITRMKFFHTFGLLGCLVLVSSKINSSEINFKSNAKELEKDQKTFDSGFATKFYNYFRVLRSRKKHKNLLLKNETLELKQELERKIHSDLRSAEELAKLKQQIKEQKERINYLKMEKKTDQSKMVFEQNQQVDNQTLGIKKLEEELQNLKQKQQEEV